MRQSLLQTLIATAEIRELFTRSHLLKDRGVEFSEAETGVWELKYGGTAYQVTFDPTLFEEEPSLRLMSLGAPLFDKLVGYAYETSG